MTTDYMPVHGTPQHAQQSMEMQTEPDQLAVSIEQGYDAEVIHPVWVWGEVREVIADTATYRTMTLDTHNPFLMAIPQDPQRCRATVIASNSAIYLCENREMAMAVNGGNTNAGALLPQNYPVVLQNKWEVYAANSVPATAATLTVITERYANDSAHI